MRSLVVSLAFLISSAASMAAQQPAGPGVAMGQPPRWEPYAGALGVAAGTTRGGALLAGVEHPVTSPLTGLFSLAGEAYGQRAQSSDAGARLIARSPLFALGAGADWSATDHRLDLLVTWRSAIRRGGLLGHGTMLRVDWLPTRNHTVAVGLHVPLMQPYAGRTRPRHTTVDYAAGRSAPRNAAEPMASVVPLIRRIAAYTNLYDASAERLLLTGAGALDTTTYAATLGAYDDSLTAAFARAAGSPLTGKAIARRARTGLLDDVLLPFDSLFGRARARGDIRPLTAVAQAHFATWVRDSSGIAGGAVGPVESAYAAWLRAIEDVQHELLAAQHGDTRFVWLPLQLALTPDQYDEQAEVDSLIARAVGRPFTDNNALAYLNSTELPLEIARSIYAARRYHVLWVHDFSGKRFDGAVDNIGYSMVADAYFPALTEAVKRYDSTGVIPAYLILLDQFFYEPRDGRLWMTMLQDPLRASVKLPGQNAEREAHLAERQAALRAAVAASPRLTRDAQRYGDRWLHHMVRVQVNITSPADWSFRSSHIIPGLPFAPDNVMRDHRKIALYDLDEADPYNGAMILMGVGVGEHYASATWEDRGYRLRGPAALEARGALRRLLATNGFRPDEIPEPLRPVASARAAERRADEGDYVGRALQVHNEVGFGAKRSSVARAMLYNLATPGSVIIVPDPLWLSDTWAGMLAAAAARGSHVFIIAPAVANAPSPEGPLMAAEHELMARMLVLSRGIAERAGDNGGELRIGIYAATTPVTDLAGRMRELREGLARAPWLRRVFPFDSATLAVLDQARTAAGGGIDATDLARDPHPRAPQLHQKTQLIALPGAIAALVRQPGWDAVLAASMRAQGAATSRFADELRFTTPPLDTVATRRSDALLTAFERSRTDAERKRVSFYFSMGTQNSDPRGIVSDAEATFIVSGFHAAAGLVDLHNLMARSQWITSQAELERYVPPPSGLMKRLARLIRPML